MRPCLGHNRGPLPRIRLGADSQILMREWWRLPLKQGRQGPGSWHHRSSRGAPRSRCRGQRGRGQEVAAEGSASLKTLPRAARQRGSLSRRALRTLAGDEHATNKRAGECRHPPEDLYSRARANTATSIRCWQMCWRIPPREHVLAHVLANNLELKSPHVLANTAARTNARACRIRSSRRKFSCRGQG